MKVSRYLLVLFLLVFLCSNNAFGQFFNPLYPAGSQTGEGGGFDDRYDYEQFLQQNQQSGLLFGQDSIEVLQRQEITTDPEELRKLGVEDEVIEDLMRLNTLQDSLTFIGFQVEQSREEGDSLSLTDIKMMIEFQKAEILRKALALPEVEVYGQEFFRKSVVHLFDQQSARVRPGDNYILGTGDEISVNVWGNRDISEKHIIDVEGGISPMIVGRVYLNGLTLGKAREILSQKYVSAYGSDKSQVEVSLNYFKTIQVNIVGEVFNPGTYTFSALNSAFNALVAVDGPNQLGTLRNIFIRRDGQTIATLDLYEYLLDPSTNQSFFLYENDYVFVPAQGPIVSIDGAVRRPMKYEMKEGESIESLIKYAGGLDKRAFTKSITLRRFESNQEVYLEVDLDSLMNNNQSFLLQNGDSLFVKSIQSDPGNYVSVGGAVRVPGNYVVKNGDRIADVLFKAGGPTENAALDKAYLLRTLNYQDKEYHNFNVSEILVNQNNADNIPIQSMDTLYLLARDSFRQTYPVYISGEVNTPGTFQYGENLHLEDLILMAGNFRREAVGSQLEVTRILEMSEDNPNKGDRIVVKRLDLGTDLNLGEEDAEFLLQPYDRVFIRRSPNFEIQQNVVILGEVQFPGEYSLVNKKEKIHSLVERAGGFTEYAFKSASKLHRKDQGPILVNLNDVFDKPKKSKYNYILADNDTIVVPKVYNYVTLRGELKYFELDSTLSQVNVPYEPNRTAAYYVKRYGGGYSKFTNKNSTFIQQPNGEVQRASQGVVFGGSPEVQNGAVITVDVKDRKKLEPERIEVRKEKEFSYNRMIDSIASGLVSVLTIVVLILQLNGGN